MQKLMNNKRLESVCKANSYEKLFNIIESRNMRPNVRCGGQRLSNYDIEQVKAYTERKISEHLGAEGSIPMPLLKLAKFFGNEYMTSLRPGITNYLVAYEAARFTQYLAESYSGLANIQGIYIHIEEVVESLSNRLELLPPGWNIDLKVLILLLGIIQHKIEETSSITPPSEELLARGIYESLRFERKLKPFLIIKKCCITQIDFINDEIVSTEAGRCSHAMMLSSTFTPYIGKFVEYSLRPYVSGEMATSDAQFGILTHLLLFFKEIERILEVILHFDNASGYEQFISSLDRALTLVLQKIKAENFLPQAVNILGTIIFVQDSLRDLLEKLGISCERQASVKSFGYLNKLERHQNMRIERVLNRNMPQITPEYSFFNALQSFFETSVLFSNEAPEEVKLILVEISMSLIFSKISVLRMSQVRAEALLIDIADLEVFLVNRCRKVPYIREIKEYLQIFACPVEEKDKFVENFILLADEKFSFYQILNVMEDQESAAELFMIYKKSKKLAS